MKKFEIERIIKTALIEDMNNGDITTENLIDIGSLSTAEMLVKEDGVIAGLDVAKNVFEFVDSEILFEKLVVDGSKVKKGDIIARIKGSTRAILMAERTALNILQRMSGIATITNLFVEKARSYGVRVVDTRKTTPGLRVLEKEAVLLGGGHNHRFNLSDAVMIKDNHIAASGGISKAIKTIREKISHTTKIEVEVETIEGLKEAIECKADIIMLDNMSNEDMTEAAKINNKEAILEASGNMSLERIEDVCKTGIDVISVGAITHSVKALDISLNIK